MSSPLNSSLMRAKQFAPQFSGVQPDAEVAQAHALIGIGEILQLILMELQSQRQKAEQQQGRQARRGRPRQPEVMDL